jgi:hypothetical protein
VKRNGGSTQFGRCFSAQALQDLPGLQGLKHLRDVLQQFSALCGLQLL